MIHVNIVGAQCNGTHALHRQRPHGSGVRRNVNSMVQ